VQLLAADHPLDPKTRRNGLENAKPISIDADAWLGGGAIVLPGRSIGANSVVGAGSVVTRDIPPNSVAVGNPCRVIRTLES
jgi:maltose O-acetyltransferase